MTEKKQIPELVLRLATAAVLIPVVIGLTVLGGIWFQLLILVLGALLAYELVNNVFSTRISILHGVVAGLFIGSGLLAIYGQVLIALPLGLIGAVVCVVNAQVKGAKAVILGGGIIFGNSAIVALIALRSDPEFGLLAVLWMFCVVWSADTLAYFAGRLIGGPKLAPKISPNKTWAGFFGGIVGAGLAGFVFVTITELGSGFALVVLSGVAAVFAQAGDLQESWAKRQLDIKDSSQLLPGHGGIWDRLDALIVVAVLGLVIGLVRGVDQSIAHHLLIW